jgi:hypothetical protein
LRLAAASTLDRRFPGVQSHADGHFRGVLAGGHAMDVSTFVAGTGGAEIYTDERG